MRTLRPSVPFQCAVEDSVQCVLWILAFLATALLFPPGASDRRWGLVKLLGQDGQSGWGPWKQIDRIRTASAGGAPRVDMGGKGELQVQRLM
ncbi:hypothetical protein F5883DRAFT_583130, partial [Diaporthe sp. PMI_573]